MGWSAPVTFVVGTMVDAARMNADVRDNISALDQHTHGGASGSGTRALGGSATGATVLYMRQGLPTTGSGTITMLHATASLLAYRPGTVATSLLLTSTAHTHGY